VTGPFPYEERHWLWGNEYTVTKITDQNTGGTLTLRTQLPPQAEQLVIRRVTPKTQEIDIQNGNRLTADIIEDANDKVTMQIQEIAEQVLNNDDEQKILQELGTALTKVDNKITAAGEQVQQFRDDINNALSVTIALTRQENTKLAQAIEAEVLERNRIDNAIVTSLNGHMEYLNRHMSTEEQARQQGDTTLQNNINAEAQARQQEDTNLTARINSVENLGDYAGAFDTYALLPKNKSGFTRVVTVNDFVTIRADENKNGMATRYIVSAINGDAITWTYDFTYSTDITGKADKVTGAVNGNFAALDANGNLMDSGAGYNSLEAAIETAVEAEAQARQQGDTNLTQAIEAEEQARRQAIEAEEQARRQAIEAEEQARRQAVSLMIPADDKGVANGVATLDADGKVPAAQLPANSGGGGGGDGKKYATFVIGNTGAGHTADKVDYLCTGTDDGVVINAAITALPAGGGKIILLEGTYNLSNSINVYKDNITIQGMGNSTILNGSYSLPSIVLRCSHSKIDSLQFTRTRSGIGIYIEIGANNNTITENTFSGPNITYAIIAYNINSNLITGNNCRSGAYGIQVSGNENMITGNNCSNESNDNDYYGIQVSGNENMITGNNCLSNHVLNNKAYSIKVSGNKNMITGNNCSNYNINNKAYGIKVSGNENMITGNNCSNYNINTFNYGICIESGNNNIINNNIVKATCSNNYCQSYMSAFYIETTNYNSVCGNNIRGVTSNGGNAYTQDGSSPAPLPGSATTIEEDISGNVFGFNIV